MNVYKKITFVFMLDLQATARARFSERETARVQSSEILFYYTEQNFFRATFKLTKQELAISVVR